MTTTDDRNGAGVLLELDERRRASLGKIGKHNRYLVYEHPDGTLVFEPAVVMSEMEARLHANPDLLAQVRDAMAHPERRRPRPQRRVAP